MPRPKKKTLESFQYAFEGIGHSVRTQRRIRVHLTVTALIIVAGSWVRLSREEWFVVCMAMALVYLTDMMQTAIAACVALHETRYGTRSETPGAVATAACLVADVLAAGMLAVVFLASPL